MNLPVILLEGLVLLPKCEIRLEFEDDLSKSLVLSSLFHQNRILVVNKFNSLSLPNIGVLGIIKNRLELPNGKSRITIEGIKRVRVIDYFNVGENVKEASFMEFEEEIIDDTIKQATKRKIQYELEQCIKVVPTISNSTLSVVNENINLSDMIDKVVNYLPINKERLCEYANISDTIIRSEMLLLDIYKERNLYEIEKEIDLKIKKELDNNQREYILKEKIKLLKKEIGDTSLKEEEIKKLRKKVANINANSDIINRIKYEINRYENMTDMSPEVGVVRNYIDWLLEIPWDRETLDIENLNDIKENLNKTHFGLDSAKLRIIEYLAVKKRNDMVDSPIICLVGPPGVGKTTLASSIAKSINRKFIKISVAGVSDECEILGHRKSYVGASPGKIISGLRKVGVKNPVILIDEVDKMSKSYKGDATNALLEILDNKQNKNFIDNYIEEAVDLSKVMFILTANNLDNIPLPIRDRLEIIEIEGYTEYEKMDILKKYLIPRVCKMHNVDKLNIKNKTLIKIIREYTKESGVRELERLISKIIRKLVTLISVDNKSLNEIIIDNSNLVSYLGKSKYHYHINIESQVGVVNGLSCTSYGGDVLPVEVNYYKGRGKLILTGSLGDVIKESAMISLSYIKANYKKFNIRYEDLINNDIHIHIPSGSIIKEGPSAGVALTTSLISAFSNLSVSNEIAMTGEITLRGNILPIGGLKEKSIGAVINNIKKMFIPLENLKDLDEIPKEVKDKIKYIPVKNYMEIYERLSKKYE